MNSIAQQSNQAPACPVCEACGQVGTRFEPVREYRERIYTGHYRESWQCVDSVCCLARQDMQRYRRLSPAVSQQLATRERAGAA